MEQFGPILQARFPGAVSDEQYMRTTFDAMHRLGFDADNTIACVGVCRDELCAPMVALATKYWGEAFNFASLTGVLLLGRTGFSAAHAHAPVVDGRRRYVYIVMPHVGLGVHGTVGACRRPGLPGLSKACGALCKLLAEYEGRALRFDLDPDDPELSLVRRRLAHELEWGHVPTLLELTEVAERAIVEDVERMIGITVDPAQADYGVLSGLIINGSEHGDFVRPGACYAVVQGERVDIAPPASPAGDK